MFQDLVDTYGIPSYKEMNPAFYTCVTFPFLFGIMFGDIGHGCLILISASILCWFGESLTKNFPLLQSLYYIRYLLLLMGVFSTFCGLIYNDFLSIPLSIFRSCYNLETGDRIYPSCVYPVGVDPVWYLS